MNKGVKNKKLAILVICAAAVLAVIEFTHVQFEHKDIPPNNIESGIQ